MKKNICIAAFVFTISTINYRLWAQPILYKPKYQNKWAQVDKYILSNWDNQICKSGDLPSIFISVFPEAPFMFYWDIYFINKGLLIHDFDYIVKGNILNLLSVVDKYGYMGNAAITNWGMNRSQPPYLSQMVMDYFEYSKDTSFLSKAYPTLCKEYTFWTDTSLSAIEQHNTSIKGLQRFYAHPKRDEMVDMYKELAGRFNLKMNVSDDEKEHISFNYAVEAATGMDFTPRFEHRCPDFIAVELNSLLYTYEKNLEIISGILKLKEKSQWSKMALSRKNLINKYCWSEARGMYLDYDYVNKRHSKVAAITTFQPLWAGIATKEQAAKVVSNSKIFESGFGMITTEKCGEIKNYQWGETSVWAPMQLLVAMGMDNYGYKKEATKVAQIYLDLVSKNFISPTPSSCLEKNGIFDRRRAGQTYEKYKYDGTINDDEYCASAMMGWTAGAHTWLYNYINKK